MSNFDPMTGEPMEGASMPEEPMTEPTMPEAPIQETPVENNTAETQMEGYSSMMGEPMENGYVVASGNASNGGSKKTPIIIGTVTAVIAVAAIVIILIFSGIFSSPQTKILTAFANTFKETSEMTEAFAGFYVMWGDSYTVGMEMEAEGQYIDFQYAVKKNDKQLSGDISIEDVPNIEFLVGIDESHVKAQLPDFSDYVFTYNYVEEKTGYLVREAGTESIDMIDAMCEMLYAQEDQAKANEEIKKLYEEVFREWEFESVDKEEFEVNGKDVSCKGYQTILTEENVIAMLDAMEESTNPEYAEVMEKADMDMGELYDDLRADVEGMDDIEATFYLYKNKIACVRFSDGISEVEVLFKGSEKGMHNIELCEDGETIFKIIGSVEGDMERYVMEEDDMETMSMEYDTKTGDYEIAGEDEFFMRGNLKSDSDGALFTIDEVESYGETFDISFTMTAKKGATLQEFEGEEIDLGNASEDELMEVAMDFVSALDY